MDQMKNDHRGNKELQERWLLRTNNLDSEAEDWLWIKWRMMDGFCPKNDSKYEMKDTSKGSMEWIGRIMNK